MVPNPVTSPPQIQLKMDPYYDITYDVPKRIDPSIPDLISHSTVHILNTARPILHEDGRLLFLLPYHEYVFWTNIKYVCHGADQPFHIGIISLTEDGQWVDILSSELRPAVTWLDTNWPIPSMPQNKNQVFLTVKPQDPAADLQYLRIKILGFTSLFPPDHSYALVDDGNRAVLLFSQEQAQERMYSIRRIQNYPSPAASTLTAVPT